MIGRAEFSRTLAYVRRAGVTDELEAVLRPEGNGGAPRALAVDVLLAAMMLCYEHNGSLAHTKIHKLLTNDLDRRFQVELRVRTATGDPITLRQVRYTLNTITDRLDSTRRRNPDLDEVGRARRADLLQSVIDRLVAPASAGLDPATRYAIDETAIDSAARGRGKNKKQNGTQRRRSFDRDARWGYRTKTFENRTNRVFGYHLTAFVRVGAVGEVDVPLLTDRIVVLPANKSATKPAIETLDGLARNGRIVSEVLADRGYSYAKPVKWADELRARGIAQVLDLHPNDRGARAESDGYLMIDGWAHCPSIPEHLKVIDRPARMTVGPKPARATKAVVAERKKRAKEVKRFRKLIAERASYRFEKVGKTSSGAERFRCPARAGKVKCDGCPFSRDFPDGLPQVEAPAEPGKACAQATITIPTRVGLKLRQELYWGSDEWIRSYARRTRVEGSFGVLKGAKNGRLTRGWTHQVGLAKTTLLLAIAVAATNLRMLLVWAKRTGDTRDPLVTMNVANHGFVELDEHGTLPDATGPPIAA